jgi:hypothetical protein
MERHEDASPRILESLTEGGIDHNKTTVGVIAVASRLAVSFLGVIDIWVAHVKPNRPTPSHQRLPRSYINNGAEEP